MNKIVLLENLIPMYSFAEDVKEQEHFENWLDRQKEIGDIGEKLVKEYLEKQYGAIVEKQPDSKGFDYMVTMRNRKCAVEVKTTTNRLKRFFISYNELKTAMKMEDNYYLYYVSIREQSASLYVICNPFRTLQIDSHLLNNAIIDNEMIQAELDGLVIVMKNIDAFLIIENLSLSNLI